MCFVATKVSLFCRNKSKLVLLQQNEVLRRQIFVVTDMFVTTKDVFCYNKGKFVAIKLLLQQNYVCCDKHAFVATKDMFVASK